MANTKVIFNAITNSLLLKKKNNNWDWSHPIKHNGTQRYGINYLSSVWKHIKLFVEESFSSSFFYTNLLRWRRYKSCDNLIFHDKIKYGGEMTCSFVRGCCILQNSMEIVFIVEIRKKFFINLGNSFQSSIQNEKEN